MPECPVINSGAMVGSLDTIRNLPMDSYIILKGRDGLTLCPPEARLSRWSVFIGQYDSYVALSGSQISAEREIKVNSRDAKFSFLISIEIFAKITDPLSFVKNFGEKASIIDPFYNKLELNIRNRAKSRLLSEIEHLNNEFNEICNSLNGSQAQEDCVAIEQLKIYADIDDKAKEFSDGIMLHDLFETYGETYFIALIASTQDLEKRKILNEFLTERRNTRIADTQENKNEIADYISLANTIFPNDPKGKKEFLEDLVKAIKPNLKNKKTSKIQNSDVLGTISPANLTARKAITDKSDDK